MEGKTMETAKVETVSVGGLLPTMELIRLAGVSLWAFHYMQRKFGALLIPAVRVGRWQFWKPSDVELLKSLRTQIRKQEPYTRPPRKGKGTRCQCGKVNKASK